MKSLEAWPAVATGRRPISSDAEEILRLRDRYHKLSTRQAALAYTIGEQGRHLQRLDEELEALRNTIESMTKADEIAAAVVAAQKAERSRGVTLGRRGLAALAGVVILIPAVHDLSRWLHL